jgi:hypothetical protein
MKIKILDRIIIIIKQTHMPPSPTRPTGHFRPPSSIPFLPYCINIKFQCQHCYYSGLGGIRFPHVKGSDSLSFKDYLT